METDDASSSLRDELETLELLQGAPHEVFDILAGFCPVRTLQAGEVLLAAGQCNDRLFIVLSGELLVHLGNEHHQHVIALRRGETVGEISMLDRRPASAQVSAHTVARVLAVPEQMFWRVCQASHGVTVRVMRRLADRLRTNVTSMHESVVQRASLEEIAQRDALTKLNSRRWLDDVLPQMCAAHANSGHALSIAVVDIDHFKNVNDTYGHQTGDVVLAEIAKVLRTKLRPTDCVARFGGEEFVVILPETYLVGARIACARLAEAVRTTSIVARDGTRLPRVTVSMGLAELAEGDDVHSLIERADAALYLAKHNGRDRIEG